jgi:hypothetical protein
MAYHSGGVRTSQLALHTQVVAGYFISYAVEPGCPSDVTIALAELFWPDRTFQPRQVERGTPQAHDADPEFYLQPITLADLEDVRTKENALDLLLENFEAGEQWAKDHQEQEEQAGRMVDELNERLRRERDHRED